MYNQCARDGKAAEYIINNQREVCTEHHGNLVKSRLNHYRGGRSEKAFQSNWDLM